MAQEFDCIREMLREFNELDDGMLNDCHTVEQLLNRAVEYLDDEKLNSLQLEIALLYKSGKIDKDDLSSYREKVPLPRISTLKIPPCRPVANIAQTKEESEKEFMPVV